MNNPFDFFDLIFYINLDTRQDRNKQSLEEFDKVGIKDRVKRISGFTVNEFTDRQKNAYFGDQLSHACGLEKAKREQARNCLIFEDDVHFVNDTLIILDQAVKQLPKNWGLFYLGVNTEMPSYQVSSRLAKLTFAYSTHAYAVNGYLFDRLIDINNNKEMIPFDVSYNSLIIPSYPCFTTIPLIAIQRPSFSNIAGMMKDYSWMETKFLSNLVRK